MAVGGGFPSNLASMVPGLDFLQGLMRNAGSGLPPMSQWIAPTLDPEELDKRIQDLRTVQFWLEQNARLIGTTIQALEVQRMTLSTLQRMNMPLSDLGRAMQMQPAPEPPPPAPAPPTRPAPPVASPAPPPAAASADRSAGDADAESGPGAGAAPSAPLADPLQWWGALTQQFTEIAAKALKDGSEAARSVVDGAGASAVAAAAAAAAAAPAAARSGARSPAGPATRSATGSATRSTPRPAAPPAPAAAPTGAAPGRKRAAAPASRSAKASAAPPPAAAGRPRRRG
jgi:hypothetical protein